MQMKFVGSPLQMHGKKKPHKAKVMIAMQVTDKDPVNLVNRNLIFQ